MLTLTDCGHPDVGREMSRQQPLKKSGSQVERPDECEQPRKVFVTSVNTDASDGETTMDSHTRGELEQLVEGAVQGQVVKRYESEVARLLSVVAEKDELILKLTRDNAELETKLEVQQSLVQMFQTRLDKVDAVMSVHDKAITSMKDTVQGLTFRLANLSPMDGKENSRQMSSPLMMASQGPMPMQGRAGSMGMMRGVAHIPPEPVSVALVGDSTFRYIDEEHLFQKSAKCYKSIVSSIDEAKTVLSDVLRERPTCVVFHLGTKDVEYTSSDICAQKMGELIRKCKETALDTQICISLLLPRSDSEPNKVKAQMYNFKVQETLAHEGVQFIIHNEFEKDGRLVTKYYQPDFVNINGLDGSRKLAAHLKHGIRKAVPSLQPQQQPMQY